MARFQRFMNDSSLMLVVLVLIPCMITSCPAAQPSKWLLDIAASDAILSVDNIKDSKKESSSFVQQITALPGITIGTDKNETTNSATVAESVLAVGAIPVERSISLTSIARKNRR